MKQPLQLNYYKGMSGSWGALQINFQKPHYFLKQNPKLKNFDGRYILDIWKNEEPNATIDDLASREGCLFFEMTSATGKNIYDWGNKILMAMSPTDLSKMLMVLEGAETEISLLHDPGAKTDAMGQIKKYLNLSSPQGIKKGVMISMSKQEGGKNTKHTVPLSGDESKLLAVFIRYVIPLTLGW